MTSPIAPFIQLFMILLVLGSYGLAIVDLNRALALGEPLEGRRPARFLEMAALLLVGLMVFLLGHVFGGSAGLHFLTQAGMLWFFQALALALLVIAGGVWARRCSAAPFCFGTGRLEQRPWSWLGIYRWLAISLAIMIGWTALLAWLWPHRTASELGALFKLEQMPPAPRWLFLAGMLSLAAILEECLFRHYLFYRIYARFRHGPASMAITTILTSAAWAVAHYGLIEPYGLKLAQTFGLGIVLSLTARRQGLYAAITLHWAFNMILVLVAIGVSRNP